MRRTGPWGMTGRSARRTPTGRALSRILRQAYTDGRLDLNEFDERTTAAYAAKTWADLRQLTSDLPVDAVLGADIEKPRVAAGTPGRPGMQEPSDPAAGPPRAGFRPVPAHRLALAGPGGLAACDRAGDTPSDLLPGGPAPGRAARPPGAWTGWFRARDGRPCPLRATLAVPRHGQPGRGQSGGGQPKQGSGQQKHGVRGRQAGRDRRQPAGRRRSSRNSVRCLPRAPAAGT